MLRNKDMIMNPTIRWETNNTIQVEEIKEEEINIYLLTISYLRSQYCTDNWEIKGLYLGAIGTAFKLILDFFKTFRKEDLSRIN